MLKYNIALKHIKVYWKDGKLKKNGRIISLKSVKKLLRELNPEFTEKELWDIIFNDISVYAELNPHLRNVAKYRNEEKRAAVKNLELKKRQEELKNTKKFKTLLETSKPSDYGLDHYMRMPHGHITAALMAAHPFLNETQAKQIFGNWILRRL